MIQYKELNLINCRLKASCNKGCSRLSLSRKPAELIDYTI